MVDVGNDTDGLSCPVPDRPFSEIRRTDRDQHRYFVGPPLPSGPTGAKRPGTQLTPPRRFITRDVEEYLPFDSPNFFPLQTLALGGLGAGWGAGAHTFEEFELNETGLPCTSLNRHY